MPHSDRPVIITRPLAQGEPLAGKLRAMGIRAITFPLLEIQTLPDTRELRETLGRLSEYAMVAFVSPNAIDAAFEHIGQWPASVIAAVVGEGSRQALAQKGLTPDNTSIVSPRNLQRTDSETLLEMLDLAALAGKKILIVRAETGRELLGDRLRDAGVQVEQIAAYRRGPPANDDTRSSQLKDLIASSGDWVITSSEALRYLKYMTLEAMGEDGWQRLLRSSLIVPHERIAQTAESLGFQHIQLTGSGDEALIAAIQSRP